MSRGSIYPKLESFSKTLAEGTEVLSIAVVIFICILASPILLPLWILGKIKIAYDKRYKD